MGNDDNKNATDNDCFDDSLGETDDLCVHITKKQQQSPATTTQPKSQNAGNANHILSMKLAKGQR